MRKKKFNEIIRELREEKEPQMTQQELATVLGTNQRKISRLETGDFEPSLDDLRLICKYYNISADYLIGLPRMPYPNENN